MDYARRYSDEQMEELRRQLEEIYGQAATEVEQKLEGFNHAFARKSQQHLADVKAGKWTQAQYQRWLLGQVFQGKQWKQKLSDITGVYTKADKIARQIIGTGNLSIFAEAANYTAFNIEQNTGLGIAFNLYDRSTVKRLLLDRPQMLPEWKIDEPKDYAWNEKRVRNAVMQGIIQGESVPDIGKRLCGELATSNGRKMGLFARTAITGAENAGRVARMEEAQDMGITVQKQWIATLDSRTRDAHQDLDGQIQDPDKPFKSALGDIMFPGDPSADPANVYNCRCTLGYYYPEYKPQNVRRRAYNDPESRESEVIDYVTYSEWKEQKKALAEPAGVQHATPVDGTDITDTWRRRKDQFDYEIEDVLDAQGFMGLPSVVDADEFYAAVRQSNFIAQRTYSAPTQEVLDGWKDQLYHGDWYVDCGTGGAQYGQGMYCAADYTGKLSSGIEEEMRHYQMLNTERGSPYATTETLTLASGAKVIKYKDIMPEYYVRIMTDDAIARRRQEFGLSAKWGKAYREALQARLDIIQAEQSRTFTTAEIRALAKKANAKESRAIDLAMREGVSGFDNLSRANYIPKYDRDVGCVAARMGYDAINAEGHGASGSYTVILNRTKVIFLRGGA